MKTIIAILAATFTIGNAHAAEVISAKVNAAKKTVSVTVRYGGGCKKHDFVLQSTGGCRESYPVQCDYELVDLTTGDHCEAMVGTTAEFTFAEMGWEDSYFNGASISIFGDNNSRAGVALPFVRK
jgi:hypothetical protein